MNNKQYVGKIVNQCMAPNNSDRVCLTPQFDNNNWNRETLVIIQIIKYALHIAT